MTEPPIPDGVLVQSVRVDGEGDEAGWRVWADGRHEGRPAGGDWIAAPTLDEGAMAALRAVLDDTDFEAMAGVHHPDVARDDADATLWLQVARPGGPRSVALVGGARLDALDALIARLMPILSGGALP